LTESETASTKQEENTCRELAADDRDRDIIAPFGYRFKFHFSTLSAIVMSMPSKVKLDKTRWNMSKATSQIGRRTPSSSMKKNYIEIRHHVKEDDHVLALING